MATTDEGRTRSYGDFPNPGFECCFPVESVEVTQDGRNVWVSTIDHRMYSIAVDGGRREERGRGVAPVVSPDGKFVAFTMGAPEDVGRGVTTELVVRELATGDESKVATLGRTPSWSPDSRTLALLEGDQIVTVHVSAEGGLGKVSPICVDSLGPSRSVTTGGPVWQDLRTLLVVVGTRSAKPQSFDYERDFISALDTGTCRLTLLAQLALPEAIGDIDLDATGRHVLLVTPTRLLRWHAGMTYPVELRKTPARRLGQVVAW